MLIEGIDLAFKHVPLLLEDVIPAAGDDAVAQAGFIAIGHGGLDRHTEIIGNQLSLHVRGLRQQPHHQKEGHHGGHKVRIGNLPRPAVVRVFFLFALT